MTRRGLIWRGRRIEGVVLDVDGTLTDSVDAYYQVFAEIMAAVGISVKREDVLDSMATGSRIWDQAIPVDVPDRELKIKRCMEMLPAVYDKVLEQVQLFPGVQPVLRSLLSAGVTLGLVTSSWRPALAPLERAGLMDLFAAVIVREDGFPAKPAPDGIAECLRRMYVEPVRALTVGDSVVDIRAGKAAGALTVAVLSGIGSRSQLEAERPSDLIRSVADLTTILTEYGLDHLADG
jgi:phosphoglycolate phosphatase